jgi:hypothetical protein
MAIAGLVRGAIVAGKAVSKLLKKKKPMATKNPKSTAKQREMEAFTRQMADKVKQGTAKITKPEVPTAKKILKKAEAKAPSNAIKKDYKKSK